MLKKHACNVVKFQKLSLDYLSLDNIIVIIPIITSEFDMKMIIKAAAINTIANMLTLIAKLLILKFKDIFMTANFLTEAIYSWGYLL